MVIRVIRLTGIRPAIELTRRHQVALYFIGISELRLFACGDYRSDLLLMRTIYWRPFIYMWRHLQTTTKTERHP